MYLPEPAWSEPVRVTRAGVVVLDTTAAYDDKAPPALYLPVCDVRRGDVASIRGLTRRITEVQTYLGAGAIATLEEAPTYLPDLGSLTRPAPGGRGHFDTSTSTWVPDGTTPIWAGTCSVESTESQGSDAEVAEQTISIVPVLIRVPLDLVDVEPGDLFTVTSSRDQRLLTRTFVVTRVEAGSTVQERIIRAVDRQE